MTILNRESDGLHSILLTLAGVVARERAIGKDDLIAICAPPVGIENIERHESESKRTKDPSSRIRFTLARWTSLGIFVEDAGMIRLSVDMRRGESVEDFLDKLPSLCRRGAVSPEHALPLWVAGGGNSEEGLGRSADLCRGLSWCLAQDIYSLPSTYAEIEGLISQQVSSDKFIFQNATRWDGFRPLARFLGFATGDDSSFFCDPTEAVHSEIREMMKKNELVAAGEFISQLSERLPMLDFGAYRLQVENELRPEAWERPPVGSLSMSLSFALRRLQMQKALNLITLADAPSRFTLIGRGGRIWDSFSHVSYLGGL